jgi:hypothetical protein
VRVWGGGLAAGLVLSLLPVTGSGASLPRTTLSYRIDVALDPEARGLTGVVHLTWTNPGKTPVEAVPLHLYLNAFSHQATTWLGNSPAGRTDLEGLLERYPDPWGRTTLEEVSQAVGGADVPVGWRSVRPDDGNPLDDTLAEVALAEAIPPSGTLELRVRFRARLPFPIARTGGHDDFFFVAQWFPKLAAFSTETGFVARQFHAPTEFFADFARYDVTIEVPEGWTVGATGKGSPPDPSGEGTVRHRYVQESVHDFAFVAGNDLHDETIPFDSGKGPPVAVRYLVPSGTAHQVPRWRRAVEGALAVLGRRVGPYPYETLTVVCPPLRAAATGGMEYPTLITGGLGDPIWDGFPFGQARVAEVVLVHEFAHQYFYGLLASDEREHAFLDEGFTTYWEGEIMGDLFEGPAVGGTLLGRPIDAYPRDALLSMRADAVREGVRKRPSWLFYPRSSTAQIYTRSGVTLRTAAELFGRGTVDSVFAAYFARYAFDHPEPDDFLALAREVGGPELAAFLEEAFVRPGIPDYRVAVAKSKRWKPPLGRVPEGEGEVLVTEESRDDRPELGLDPDALEPDGRILMEIVDPGWVSAAEDRRGIVTRRRVTPERRDESDEVDEGFHETHVRVEGPAWAHLPVTVLFRFADGVEVRDEWDGRAAWRRYRFLRAARLREVRVDPEGRIALDVSPENNAVAIEPDGRFVSDWSGWLAALAVWISAGVTLWL